MSIHKRNYTHPLTLEEQVGYYDADNVDFPKISLEDEAYTKHH